jgi:chemotaxis protein methyltransferase CheR
MSSTMRAQSVLASSELFRDSGYFLELRQEMLPHLAIHPFRRIWVAGCRTGAESYSLAILLHELGLLERSQIYSTDIDPKSLQLARGGEYDIRRLPEFSANYLEARGKTSLSEYSSNSSTIAFGGFLTMRIVFSDHRLATDSAFAEVQLVSCRNVLIYFQRSLQERSVDLFLQSLSPRGFLGLGSRETLAFSSHGCASTRSPPANASTESNYDIAARQLAPAC